MKHAKLAALFTISLVTFGIGVYYYVGSKRKRLLSRKSGFPGLSPSHPVLGNLKEVGAAGSPQQFMENLQMQYGSFASFYWRDELTVSLSSPDLLRTQERLFDRATNLWSLYRDLLGSSSLPFTNGQEGRQRRDVYDKLLYSSDDFYLPIFVDEAEKLVEQWRGKAQSGEPIALNSEINNIAMRLTMRALYAHAPSDDEVATLQRSYDVYVDEVRKCLEDPLNKPPDVFYSQQRVDAVSSIRGYCQRMIDTHRSKREAEAVVESRLLIDKLFELLSEQKIDEETLLNDVVTFWVGGFHTTAAFIMWSLYLLAKYPSTQENVRLEIDSALEGGKIRELTKSLVSSLSYLRQFQNEVIRHSLRYMAYALREADTDMRIGDYIVPAKTTIWHNLSGPFRDSRYFTNPEDFDPEHFSVAACRSRPACSFEPFGIGKRKCPGYKVTYLECSTVIIVALQNLRFRLLTADQVKQKAGMSVYPESDLLVVAEEVGLR